MSATTIAPNTPSAMAERRIARRTVLLYLIVACAKTRLKTANPRPSRPTGSIAERGFRSSAHIAGVNVSAMSAEISTDTDSVSANCL